MTDEANTQVTQAVADSNASTSASLSTAVAQDSAAPASLSTSVSTGQEVPGTLGESMPTAGTTLPASGGASQSQVEPSSSNPGLPLSSGSSGSLAPDSSATEDAKSSDAPAPTGDHPAKTHIRGFLRKIEAGEAIVLADVEALLRRIEEAL
ncbi:hypothetical protein [Burkholderia plantarii]|uniref:hypothetical protein n=1 Tax=Burkholderia plantarii TaxID=41899 RepID=UPI0008707782|nr:hypothetical protein [Burkholderia plantarii]